jgi:hypothetical protein
MMDLQWGKLFILKCRNYVHMSLIWKKLICLCNLLLRYLVLMYISIYLNILIIVCLLVSSFLFWMLILWNLYFCYLYLHGYLLCHCFILSALHFLYYSDTIYELINLLMIILVNTILSLKKLIIVAILIIFVDFLLYFHPFIILLMNHTHLFCFMLEFATQQFFYHC